MTKTETTNGLSRQQAWAARKSAAGLCTICGRRKLARKSKTRCKTCQNRQSEINRLCRLRKKAALNGESLETPKRKKKSVRKPAKRRTSKRKPAKSK